MKFSSHRGLLLVEAVLSAVVIATGLIFISRGLGSQLNALRKIEEYDTLTSLAHGKLLELEGKMLFHHLLPVDRRGNFTEPYATYQWEVTAALREDATQAADESPMTAEVVVTVQRQDLTDRAAAAVRIRAVWPMDWVPPEWIGVSNG